MASPPKLCYLVIREAMFLSNDLYLIKYIKFTKIMIYACKF